VSLQGGVRLGGLVSQGCRPVGEAYTVTKADSNLLYGIGSRDAYEMLEETFEKLSSDDQEIARHNMLVGLAIDEYGEEHGTGDFLVRSILGGDPDAGALAVGAFPRTGQTMQFQVRDRDAADAELRRLCLEALEPKGERAGEPFGGLCFTCAGRGSQMFGVPNHDAGIIEEVFGKVPLGGILCNGEIGPVGGTNFVHGYTASVALLYDA
jgi:small ligand-binding sensory domain FIST